MPITAADPFSPLGVHAGEECALPPLCGKLTVRSLRGALRAVNRPFSEHLLWSFFGFAPGSSNQQSAVVLPTVSARGKAELAEGVTLARLR